MPIATRTARVFASVADLRRFLREGDAVDPDTVGDVTSQPLGEDMGAAPRIEPTDGGWQLTIGEAVTSHETREEAFAAVEASDWFGEVLARKHASAAAFEAFAAGRWLDSTSVEDLPSSIDGSQIREQMIGEMARNLARAKTPIPIDGGGVSGVHESVIDSAAKAAGWSFAGVEVLDAEGRSHLWLWARLHEDVDGSLERGELLYGSVAFLGQDTDRYGDGADIGARLVSYALTNTPFVDGLEPHAPRGRSNQIPAGPWLAITKSRRLNMSEKAPATEPTNDPTPEPDHVEPTAPDPTEPTAERALLDGFESEEAQDSWTQSVREELAGVFGEEAADPATLLDALRAAKDAFKGALGGAGDDAEPDAGPGGQDGDRSIRAEAIGLRAQLKAQGEEIAKLRADQRRRDIEGYLDESFRAAKLVTEDGKAALTAEDRAELVEMCERAGDDWQKPVNAALRWKNAPPTGTVSGNPPRHAMGAQPVSTDEALEIAANELRAKGEKLTKKQLRAQSYALAKGRWPEVFRAHLQGGAE